MRYKTTLLSVKDLKRQWYVIDATNLVLGRLATRVATVLMGKHKTNYVTNLDNGDFVIVLNCGKVRLTGNKFNTMTYQRVSGYLSGQKTVAFKQEFDRDPTYAVREAVRRMLPKTNRGRLMINKLKLYTTAEHPHKSQEPVALDLATIRKGRFKLDDK